MFDAYCTDCSRRQLISPGQVLGLRNDVDGIHVLYRCSKGHVGALVTGRAVTERTAA